MVDALASGASVLTGVEVQVLSWAPSYPSHIRSYLLKTIDFSVVFLYLYFHS